MQRLQSPIWPSPDDWSPDGGLEFEYLRVPASDLDGLRTVFKRSPVLRGSIKVRVALFRFNQDNIVGIDVWKRQSPDNVSIAANDHWRGSGNAHTANVVRGLGGYRWPRVSDSVPDVRHSQDQVGIIG